MKELEQGTITYVRLQQEDIVGRYVESNEKYITLSDVLVIVPLQSHIRKISGVDKNWNFMQFASCMPILSEYSINLNSVVTFCKLEDSVAKVYEENCENLFNSPEDFLGDSSEYEMVKVDEHGWDDGEPEIPLDFNEDDEFTQG